MLDFEGELAKAVKYFWQIRGRQKKRQGGKSGKKDAGERSSVTGGKHADGFIRLIAAIVKDAALPKVEIHVTEKKPRTLPGFYRPCKEWDLVVQSGDTLVAVVEVKSQAGSFGNNFNNREHESSIRPTKPIILKPYRVDEAFQKRSYAKRYELVCERLVRDRLYDAACFFTSNARTGKRGEYQEPNQELSIKNFAISLHARAAAFARLGEEVKVLEASNEK